eukprot:Em0010g350a
MYLGGIYQLDKDTDASFQDGSDKEDDDTSVESDSSSVNDTDPAAGAILVPDFKNIPDQDDIFATPWGKEHYLKYFPRQTRPSDRHSPFKRTLIRQIVKELEPSTRMILMGTKKSRFVGHIGIIKQLQKVNANLPLENLLDVAYEIEYYLMVLESDVKRQLSLLLSSVNKHIVWPEGKRFPNELKGIIVKLSSNGWMNEELTLQWMDEVWGTSQEQRILIWDSYRCHTTDPVEDAVLESNSVSVIVPGGCTKILQPADVSWSAPFKSAYRLHCDSWLARDDRSVTAAGNPRAPQSTHGTMGCSILEEHLSRSDS